MNRMAIGRIFLVLVLLMIRLPVTKAETPITLAKAIRLAFDQNKNLRSSRLEAEAAHLSVAEASSMFFPRINIEQTAGWTDQPVAVFGTKLNQSRITSYDFNPDILNDPDMDSNSISSVVIQQPVFNSGREYFGLQAARNFSEKSGYEVEVRTESILIAVIEAYLTTVKARESLKVNEDAIATAESDLELIHRRFEQGLVIKSDVLQASVHLAQMKEKRIIAKNQYHLSSRYLNTLLGNPDAGLIPADEMSGGTCPEVDLATLKKWALQDRPEIKSLSADEKTSALMLKQARWAFLPEFNAMGSYDYNGESILKDGDASFSVALRLKWNIFNGGGDRYRIHKARTQLAALQETKRWVIDQISYEVEKSYYDLLAAEERVRTQQEAVSLADETLRIITQRFQEGAQTTADLLRAELALTSSRLNLVTAEFDLVLGHSYLCKSTGHLATRWLAPDRCPQPLIISQDHGSSGSGLKGE